MQRKISKRLPERSLLIIIFFLVMFALLIIRPSRPKSPRPPMKHLPVPHKKLLPTPPRGASFLT